MANLNHRNEYAKLLIKVADDLTNSFLARVSDIASKRGVSFDKEHKIALNKNIEKAQANALVAKENHDQISPKGSNIANT